MKIYHCIGVMSGTSLDGVDICYIAFNYPSYKFNIIKAETLVYTKEWENKLRNAILLPPEELLKLHTDYGFYLGDKIKNFCQEHHISNLDFIASHGHTIFHNPKQSYTLQIGHGAAIAETVTCKTICDFRSQDVILGGQGAPLVPIGDELLFNQYDGCLNLGGFSNISFKRNEKRIAFDISPVNIILNPIAKRKGLNYDLEGRLAKNGKIITNLLNQLNQLEYYYFLPPKSLGFEWCLQYINPLIDLYKDSPENLLATFTQHFSEQISKTINDNKLKSVLITGGGTKNKYLIELIKFQTSAEIIIPDEKLIDFKEALIFAFLGMLRLEKQNNILSSVTGAPKDHSSGIIYYP